LSDPSGWLDQLLGNLERCGPSGAAAVQYMRLRGITLGMHDQPTAARWRLEKRIEIHPRYADGAADAPYALSLVVHEVEHLRQGLFVALSVYGELAAWQAQFVFMGEVAGRFHDDPRQEGVIARLSALALCWDRSVLESARRLMREYAGESYRIDLLPLYPLHQEIVFWLTRREPSRP
jgi:hypothetical protein